MGGRSPDKLRVAPPPLTPRVQGPLDPNKCVHMDWGGHLCGRMGRCQTSEDENLVTCLKCKAILATWRKELAIK